jgi:hydroxymethylpyrimidine pyrophosphatase-like HAD family hydrolase
MYDGALIMHDDTVLHTNLLSAEVAQQSVDILVEGGVQPVVHHLMDGVEETWTGPAEFDNEWVGAYFASYAHVMRRLPYADCCIGNPDPLRVVAFTSLERAHQLSAVVDGLDCAWNVTINGSYGTAELVTMHKTCSKASGVTILARHLNIPLTQVMAIGDNNNDIEMLQAVGWGVAMGQALKRVKDAAHAITASNAHDGVALAIERYALDRTGGIEAADDVESDAANSFRRSI